MKATNKTIVVTGAGSGKDATMLDILYRLNPKFATNFIGKMMKKVVM